MLPRQRRHRLGALWVTWRDRHGQGLLCPVAEEGKELLFHPSPEAGAATAPPGVGRAREAAGKESPSICSCFKGGAEERKHGPAPGTEHTARGSSDAEGEGIFKTNV